MRGTRRDSSETESKIVALGYTRLTRHWSTWALSSLSDPGCIFNASEFTLAVPRHPRRSHAELRPRLTQRRQERKGGEGLTGPSPGVQSLRLRADQVIE